MDYAIAFLVLLVLLALSSRRRWRTLILKRLPLPPGPTGIPFVGNVHDMPHEHPWLTFANWAREFGDIVYVEIFGSSTIVLNSAKAVTEFFEKRSSNYADRPRMIMANELMEWGWDFAHMRYSEKWRHHRKTFHSNFQSRNILSYQTTQQKAIIEFLRHLLSSPEGFVNHTRHYAGSVILHLVYGYDVKTENDRYVTLAGEAMKGLTQAVHAGSFWVEYFPFLKHVPEWFPGASFKRKAKFWAQSAIALRDLPFNEVQELINNGTATSCFVTENLEKSNSLGLLSPDQEDVIKNCAGIAYLAGSDTTVSLLMSWMLAMVLNPKVQACAQEEIDSVVGHTRLPSFKDRPKLPYIEAMLTETLRWGPITPLAVPHRSVDEDIYEGYYIPAGATVLGNSWAILHDETLYPEPLEYKPDRFLAAPGKVLPPDPSTVGAFGFGRRICPGRHVATSTAWIAIVSILSTFNIRKPLDALGNEYNPPVDYTDGLVVHPKPFSMRLDTRSERSANLVAASHDDI